MLSSKSAMVLALILVERHQGLVKLVKARDFIKITMRKFVSVLESQLPRLYALSILLQVNDFFRKQITRDHHLIRDR